MLFRCVRQLIVGERRVFGTMSYSFPLMMASASAMVVNPATGLVKAKNSKMLKSFLFHIATGPKTDPSKCALSFLVAAKTLEKGHKVDLFLASDAVELLQDEVLSTLVGVGTGSLAENHKALCDGGATFYVSGMSCKARGITPDMLSTKNKGGTPVTFEMPPTLVDLSLAADIIFTY